MKAKSKTTSAKVAVTLVKMKSSVEFEHPESDLSLPREEVKGTERKTSGNEGRSQPGELAALT
jgi:hypothetical protein